MFPCKQVYKALRDPLPPFAFTSYADAMTNHRFAFGNKIALTVDLVNIEATCASALPTHSRSSWGPLLNGTSKTCSLNLNQYS